MRPRRVLFVIHSIKLAEAESVLVNFAAHLDRRLFRPSVLLPRTSAVSALLTDAHIPYYTVPSSEYVMAPATAWDASSNLCAVRPLYEAIVGLSPNVVIVNNDTIPMAIIAAMATCIALVVHLHTPHHQPTRLSERERMGERMWLQFADVLFACSPLVARFYEDLLGRPIVTLQNTAPAVIPAYEAVLDAALGMPGSERRQLGQVAARYFMNRHEAEE